MELNEAFSPFLTECEADYVIRYSQTDRLESVETVFPVKNSFHVVRDRSGRLCRRFYDTACEDRPYATGWYNWEERTADIEFLPCGKGILRTIGNCFYHVGWESLLMHENRMVLHASCVDTALGGILFSGVSGSGKSTQADLWVRCENGRLINGDRTILHQKDGTWMGYGSPYAGSSECYVNEGVPVRAIVFPEKAESCSLDPIAQAAAFKRIFSGMTVNGWNPAFVDAACQFVEKLIQDVPVYLLKCTKDREAVETLKEALA